MRRAFTLVELLSVTTILIVLAIAMTTSAVRASRRAKVARAQAELAQIAAEINTAKNGTEVAQRYVGGTVRDPWGQPYRVTWREVKSEGGAELGTGSTAVRVPNATAPERSVR